MRIPPENIEIEKLYSQIIRNENHAIVLSSANEGEGVTSIAMALVHRALLAGHQALMVDFNLSNPSLHEFIDFDDKMDKTNVFEEPRLVTTAEEPVALLGITAPTRRDLIIKLRKPGSIEMYIKQWREVFDFIIFDTSPINQINHDNIPAERIISASDGVFLVVHAGETNEMMVTTAVRKIKEAEGDILGSIFNDMDNPTLKDELLREARRLEPRFNYFSKRIKKIIRNSRLLSTEI